MTPTEATSDGRGFRSDALATMRMKRMRQANRLKGFLSSLAICVSCLSLRFTMR
jgi:hypothetical protein